MQSHFELQRVCLYERSLGAPVNTHVYSQTVHRNGKFILCRWARMQSAWANTHIDDAAGQRFLQQPIHLPAPTTLSTLPSFSFRFLFLYYHPSIWAEDRRKEYICHIFMSVCVHVGSKMDRDDGWFTDSTVIRTASAANKVQQKAMQGSKVEPGWLMASPLSRAPRGEQGEFLVGCHLTSVQWGLLEVLGETKTKIKRKKQTEVKKKKVKLSTVIIAICFHSFQVLWALENDISEAHHHPITIEIP